MLRPTLLLIPIAVGVLQLSCRVYCGTWWTPHPMTTMDMDFSFACWLYCSALGAMKPVWLWRIVADSGAALSIAAGPLLARRHRAGKWCALAGGALLFPTGILVWAAAWAADRISPPAELPSHRSESGP